MNSPRGSLFLLPNTEWASECVLQRGTLDDTPYSGENYRLNSWKYLYLPEPVDMTVIGIVKKRIEYATDELLDPILLLGNDSHVYSYVLEKLYLVANSLQELLDEGYQIRAQYDFNEEIEVDDDDDPEIKALQEGVKQFIDKDADEFNAFLLQFLSERL